MHNEEVLANVITLWNYHCKIDDIPTSVHQLRVIIGLGSYDLRVAEYCARLYLKGYAAKIIFTGKAGNWTIGKWGSSEARVFAIRALALGVPDTDIILEQEATNIGENIQFSRSIVNNLLPDTKEVILITKPQTTRRAYATFKAFWPEMPVLLSAPPIMLEDVAEGMSIDGLIHELVGDTERVIHYPQFGFQICQEVPKNVMAAYLYLKEAGYVSHCLKNNG